MRVLHLIAPGPLAGAERVVLTGVAALTTLAPGTAIGVFVDSRAPAHGVEFIAEATRRGIDARALPCSGRLDPRLMISLARSWGRDGWDVVHAHGYKALAYGLSAGYRRGPIAHLVATHHGDTAATGAVRFYERVAIGLYRRTERVFAVCRAAARDLAARGVMQSRLAVVLNPAELGETAAPPAPGPLRLLFAGRLVPEKGLDSLISALARPGLDSVVLHICGDGPARAALESAARPFGARIRFHGWVDDIRPRLADSHALVLPSQREGLPMIVLESMSAGRPVIATDVGGIAEVVDAGRTGLLVPALDTSALARAIIDLDGDRDAFGERARAGAAAFRERLGPARWAEQTLTEYERVLGSARVDVRRLVGTDYALADGAGS